VQISSCIDPSADEVVGDVRIGDLREEHGTTEYLCYR
jgi:hypothetical protein